MKIVKVTLLSATMLWASFATAQDYTQQIVDQLIADGYSDVQITRTLLGRVRIIAVGENGLREIVIQPSNGAVLRDREQPQKTNLPSPNSTQADDEPSAPTLQPEYGDNEKDDRPNQPDGRRDDDRNGPDRGRDGDRPDRDRPTREER